MGRIDTVPTTGSTNADALKALENGAEFINDASTLTFDSDLAKVVAEANAGLILNHMRGTPETWAKLGTLAFPMKSVMEDLEAGINRARRAGMTPPDRRLPDSDVSVIPHGNIPCVLARCRIRCITGNFGKSGRG